MADEIKLVGQGTDIIFRENIDRNGPALVVAQGDKQALRQAINLVLGPGDEQLVTGNFSRIEDFTAAPIAMFTDEADADAFLATKGAGFKKNSRVNVIDGFNFIIEVEP